MRSVDHYKPLGPGDEPPQAPVTAAVALADKIDALCAFFAIDKKPTGSSDPFALRRAALGVIAIITSNELRLDLRALINAGLTALRDGGAATIDPERSDRLICEELLAFIRDRLRVDLRDKGFRHDLIEAAAPPVGGDGPFDLHLIVRKVSALQEFLQSNDGENLAAAYTRAANILAAENKKSALGALSVDEARLKADEEIALNKALGTAAAGVAAALSREDYEEAMSAMAQLREPMDRFFEQVTVNADDAALRDNRLALLQKITSEFAQLADFSKLDG